MHSTFASVLMVHFAVYLYTKHARVVRYCMNDLSYLDNNADLLVLSYVHGEKRCIENTPTVRLQNCAPGYS